MLKSTIAERALLPTQLELQIRVAKALLSKGIKVEYKVHPERRFQRTKSCDLGV